MLFSHRNQSSDLHSKRIVCCANHLTGFYVKTTLVLNGLKTLENICGKSKNWKPYPMTLFQLQLMLWVYTRVFPHECELKAIKETLDKKERKLLSKRICDIYLKLLWKSIILSWMVKLNNTFQELPLALNMHHFTFEFLWKR